MKKGLKAALSMVAAVGFLTGVAVAECPDFSSGVPSVIITDKTTVNGEFDPATSTSSNLFVFNDAFTLSNYIDLGSESVGDVKFLFVEYQDADDTTPQTGSGVGGAWITIGGNFGEATEPTGADVRANGEAVNVALDFRNEFLSPSPDSLPYPDPDTAYLDPNTSGTRVITVFIAGANTDCDTTPTLASFDVITSKAAAADGLTGAVSIFSPEESYGTVPPNAADFENWQWIDFSLDPAIVVPALTNGQFAPAATTEITVGSTTGTDGDAILGDWKKAMSTSFAAGTLYRLRATVSTTIPVVAEPLNTASNLASQSVQWRFRFGNQFGTNDGYGAMQYDVSASGAPNSTDGDVELSAWHAPKSSEGVDPGAIDLDYVDIGVSQGGTVPDAFGHNVTVKQVVLESTSRNLLMASATTLINAGGAISDEDGISAPSGETAFGGTWTGLGLGTATTANNGSNLGATFTDASGTGVGLAIWSSPSFTGANGKVYVADVYMRASSATAQSGTRNPLPNAIFRFSPDNLVGFNQGLIGASVYSLRTDNNHDGTTDNASGLTPGATTTRVYTTIFQPTYNTTIQPNTDTQLAIQLNSGLDASADGGANCALVIERIVISELDAPN